MVQKAQSNLQALHSDSERFSNSKMNIDSFQLDQLTTLVYLHCLNLMPLAASTTPKAVDDALTARTVVSPELQTIEIPLNTSTVTTAEEYARTNDLTLAAVIESALKSYLR